MTLLIADRNRNVREFLRREMAAEGYRVYLAKTAQEVLKLVYSREHLDVLILDPDLPGAGELPLLEKIEDRIPILPVVLHAYAADFANGVDVSGAAAFVEKEGCSIENLKDAVFQVLKRPNPNGMPGAGGPSSHSAAT